MGPEVARPGGFTARGIGPAHVFDNRIGDDGRPAQKAWEIEASRTTSRIYLGVSERAAWGIVDQVVSSASNFGLAVVVARTVSQSDFGVFAVLFAMYLIAAGLCQGLTSGPLTVVYAGRSKAEIDLVIARSTGAAVAFGVIAGVACLVAAPVINERLRLPVAVLGVSLPGLLLQDAWRYSFVAASRPRSAALNDAVWILTQTVFFLPVLHGQHRSLVGLEVIWGGAANVAAMLGVWQAGCWPRPTRAAGWLSEHQGLAIRFAFESLIVRGSFQLTLVAITTTVGLSGAGAMRGAQVLFSPLNSLFLASLFVAIAEAVRVLRRSSDALSKIVSAISAGMLALTILWVAIAFLSVQQLGRQLLGATWASAAPLMLPTTIQYLATATSMGPQVGLKAMAAADHSLTSQVAYGMFIVLGGLGGAAVRGTYGAAWGVALAGVVACGVWWGLFLSGRGRWLATVR